MDIQEQVIREWFFRLPKGYTEPPYTDSELMVLAETIRDLGASADIFQTSDPEPVPLIESAITVHESVPDDTDDDELLETVGAGGLRYERLIYNNLSNADVPGLDPGDHPGAGFSNIGSGDIEAMYHGKPFNIEIKSSVTDQMGGGSVQYIRRGSKLVPSSKLEAATHPDDLTRILSRVRKNLPNIDSYLDALAKEEPVSVHAEEADHGIPFVASYQAKENLKNNGYQAAVQDYIKLDSRYIKNWYNSKNVYYIQIGGAGLFYMNDNPLKLPVPELQGEIQVEIRLRYGGDTGGSTTRAFTKRAGSDEPIEARNAQLSAIGRLITRSTSPYTLDDMMSIEEMFNQLQAD